MVYIIIAVHVCTPASYYYGGGGGGGDMHNAPAICGYSSSTHLPMSLLCYPTNHDIPL